MKDEEGLARQLFSSEAGKILKPYGAAVLDPEMGQHELERALAARMPSTQGLVSRFVELASNGGLQPGFTDVLPSRYLQLQTEVSRILSVLVVLDVSLDKFAPVTFEVFTNSNFIFDRFP